MLRRPVDLSLVTKPSAPAHLYSPPAFSDQEPLGPERPRAQMQSMCRIEPYRLGDTDDIMMDVTMGHSTPHTHAEVFLHSWYWFSNLTDKQKGVIRDTSQVPASEIVGEGAVVDVSDQEIGSLLDLKLFKERAKHVRPGDLVILNVGGHKRYHLEPSKAGRPPSLTPEIAEWLVNEKKIKMIAQDIPVNGMKDFWSVESVFYLNGVLMIDYAGKLSSLQRERVYVNGGVVMRWAGVDDSPSRLMAVETDGHLAEGRMVDLFEPIILQGDAPKPPFMRREPLELKSQIMKRYRVKNFQLPLGSEYSVDFLGWVGFKIFNNRLGTHILVPYGDMAGDHVECWDLSRTPADRLCGKAIMVDLSSCVGPEQNVTVRALESHAKGIEPGDIVLIRTNYSDNYYYNTDFIKYSPGFEVKALRWLVDKGVKMIITDAASLEKSPQTLSSSLEGQAVLSSAGVPAVLCASHMWMIQKQRFFVFCSPLPLTGLNAAPCRVIAVEEWE